MALPFPSAKMMKVVLPTRTMKVGATRNLSLISRANFKDPVLYSEQDSKPCRPVIGILSHPGDGAMKRLNQAENASNIPASYVKLVEMGGARVIPLIYNEPTDTIFKKLELVNGILYTGGWALKEEYYTYIVERVFKKVLEKNDAGQYLPLHAICLGFELLSMIAGKNWHILDNCAAKYYPSTLHFTENTNMEGTVFERFPPELIEKLRNDRLAMNNNQNCITPERMLENPDLSGFFKILTTSRDRNNKVFVSTVQAYNYPITAFQWHPEKNAFEWGNNMIPHSEDAVRVTQHVANFLIREARKSLNRPPTQEVLDNLIYNYSATYCGTAGKGFDQVYIFQP